MQRSLVLTVLATDRTGLVDQVASAVAQHGGNWIESRLVRLAGHFAGLVRVQVDEVDLAQLKASLNALAGDVGIRVVDELTGDESVTPQARLSLIGHDRSGIVADITRALVKAGVNVIALETQVTSAPMTGEPLFNATAELAFPEAMDIDALRDALDAIADRLDLDLHLDLTPLESQAG